MDAARARRKPDSARAPKPALIVRRASLLGAALCLTAVLAALVGGLARADAVAHHRSAITAISSTTGDTSPHGIRVDQPAVVETGAAARFAGVAARGTADPSAFARLRTAGAAEPRGPPGHAR